MRRSSARRSFQGVILILASLAIPSIAAAQTSPWAQLVNGTLSYETTANGDHIMDFSYAGYMGGGVALPTSYSVVQTLYPAGCPSACSGADDTATIQAAIESVANLIRGTGNLGEVLLAPGTFHISSTISISFDSKNNMQSGVVLSGSGSASGGTIVNWTGASGSVAFQIGQTEGTGTNSNTVNLTQSYIPSGSMSATVSSTSGFSVGQEVLITRPTTAAWISYMGMTATIGDEMWICPSDGVDPLGGTCTPASTTTDRTITAINTSTNTITFSAPITDSFNSAYLGTPVGTLSVYTPNLRVQNVGLQHLEILAPIVATSTGSAIYSAVNMQNAFNSWILDVVGQETQNAFTIDQNTRQVTLEKVINNLSTAQTAGAGSADFAVTGTQIFVDNCQSNGSGDWPLLTQSGGTGPIAVLNFSSTQHGGIGGHQRWTTGLLVDNATLPNAPSATPGIAFLNRGLGVGQGWAMGWSVAWNVTTPYTTVATPPGAENWCIGCQGSQVSNASSTPNGIYDSFGTKVTPSSLYLEQLKERLGQLALDAIGYGTYTTTTTLTLSAAQIFPNSPVTLTATVTSSGGAPATGAVTFTNGTAVLGTATVTNGVAALTLNTLAIGSYSIVASFGAVANYAGSASAASALSVVAPVSLALSPSSLSLAATATGGSILTISPAPGYTGLVALTCSSPVAYVTCTVASLVSISGTAAVTAAVTINVSATASLQSPQSGPEKTSGIAYAGFLPLTAPLPLLLLPLLRRRKLLTYRGLSLFALFLVTVATFAMSGCGGSSTSSGTSLPPAGSQAITLTAAANGTAVSTTLTVNLTN